MEYLCTRSMQYVLLLYHIVLKFTLHSWQVPRSSVGRALYRESGPSQDGDPVPGNLPFFFNFFFNHLLLFLFYTKLTNRLECLHILFSYFIRQGFLLLIGKFTLFHTIIVMTCIGMPRNLSIVKSNNKDFGDVFVL